MFYLKRFSHVYDSVFYELSLVCCIGALSAVIFKVSHKYRSFEWISMGNSDFERMGSFIIQRCMVKLKKFDVIDKGLK